MTGVSLLTLVLTLFILLIIFKFVEKQISLHNGILIMMYYFAKHNYPTIIIKSKFFLITIQGVESFDDKLAMPNRHLFPKLS